LKPAVSSNAALDQIELDTGIGSPVSMEDAMRAFMPASHSVDAGAARQHLQQHIGPGGDVSG
jgi:hypothetical protein